MHTLYFSFYFRSFHIRIFMVVNKHWPQNLIFSNLLLQCTCTMQTETYEKKEQYIAEQTFACKMERLSREMLRETTTKHSKPKDVHNVESQNVVICI